MAWQLGPVGHFGLSVRDPKASARWWIDNLNCKQQFAFDGAIAVGTDAVTIALHKGAKRR